MSINVVVTHQGPAWATFITTTRTLLTGKRDRLWGRFPPAGIAESDFDRLRSLGEAVARQFDALAGPNGRPLLRGLGAVEVNRRYVIAGTRGRPGVSLLGPGDPPVPGAWGARCGTWGSSSSCTSCC